MDTVAEAGAGVILVPSRRAAAASLEAPEHTPVTVLTRAAKWCRSTTDPSLATGDEVGQQVVTESAPRAGARRQHAPNAELTTAMTATTSAGAPNEVHVVMQNRSNLNTSNVSNR